jgi:hypothetical protein
LDIEFSEFIYLLSCESSTAVREKKIKKKGKMGKRKVTRTKKKESKKKISNIQKE